MWVAWKMETGQNCELVWARKKGLEEQKTKSEDKEERLCKKREK